MTWLLPVGVIAGLEGPDADTVARCLTGTIAEQPRGERSDSAPHGPCLTVEQWRMQQVTR